MRPPKMMEQRPVIKKKLNKLRRQRLRPPGGQQGGHRSAYGIIHCVQLGKHPFVEVGHPLSAAPARLVVP